MNTLATYAVATAFVVLVVVVIGFVLATAGPDVLLSTVGEAFP